MKGYQSGGAAVHTKQALVLINKEGKASGRDIVNLASYIRQKVFERFGVQLEPEVRFIDGMARLTRWMLFHERDINSSITHQYPC